MPRPWSTLSRLRCRFRSLTGRNRTQGGWLGGWLGGRLGGLRFRVAIIFAGTLTRHDAVKSFLATGITTIIRDLIWSAVQRFIAANLLRPTIIPSGERHFTAFIVHLVPWAGWLWPVALLGRRGVKVCLAALLERIIFPIVTIRVISELVVADPIIKIPRPWSTLSRLRRRFRSLSGRNRTRGWLGGWLGGRLGGLGSRVAMVVTGTFTGPAATKPLLATVNTVVIREVRWCAKHWFVAANTLRWAIIPSGEHHFAAFIVHLVPWARWLWPVTIVGGWGAKVCLAASLERIIFLVITI